MEDLAADACLQDRLNSETPEMKGDTDTLGTQHEHDNLEKHSNIHSSPANRKIHGKEASSDLATMSEASIESEGDHKGSRTTTLVRGLSVCQTMRYETGTDAEPENLAGSVGTSPEPADDSISEGITMQIESRGDESASTIHALQNQLQALEKTQENAKSTLGTTHPLVKTFISNLDLLRDAIAKDVDQEQAGLGTSEAAPPETSNDGSSTTPYPPSTASPRGISTSVEPSTKNSDTLEIDQPTTNAGTSEDLISKCNDHGSTNFNGGMEKDDKVLPSGAASKEAPCKPSPENSLAASQGPDKVDHVATASRTVPGSRLVRSQRGEDSPLATPSRDQPEADNSIAMKSSAFHGTSGEATAHDYRDFAQSSGLDSSHDLEKHSDTLETKSPRSRRVSFKDHMNDSGPQFHTITRPSKATINVDTSGDPLSDPNRQPPEIKTKGLPLGSSLRPCMKQAETPSTTASEPVRRNIDDWFNTSQPPPRIRDSHIVALRLATVAVGDMLLDFLHWVFRSCDPEAAVPNGKVRVRWTCVSNALSR